MKFKEFKLAMVQMNVEGGQKEKNLQHALDLIAEAASKGAQVALLPECMDLGWTHSSCHELAEEIPQGNTCRKLMDAAKKHSIYICSGLTEKSGNKIYNSAVIIDPQGNLICKHRKINELYIAHDCYACGDSLNVVETEYGTWGLMICADATATDKVLSRSLCLMGADVILSPTAWAVDADFDNDKTPYGETWINHYGPVSREFGTAIIGVSNVGPVTGGPWKGKICIGCSLAYGADGEIITKGPYGVDAECIIYIDVKPSERSGKRIRQK